MKLKRILTGIVAAAVAVSTFAISSFAASVTLDTEYKGDWSSAGNITVDNFEGMEGSYIKVVLEVEATNIGDDKPYILKPMQVDTSWDAITSTCTSNTAVSKPDGFMQIQKDQTSLEFVLPNTFLDVKTNNQLAFQVCNVIIKSAELTAVSGPQGEIAIVAEADTVAYCNKADGWESLVPERTIVEETVEETTEEDAATEDDAAEDDAAEDDAAEDDAATEEDAAIEPDWDSYDADAAKAANEAFVFGTNEMIDLYAVLGDNWADLAKVDATFVWTPGAGGWCGGAGIGNGAVLADGTNWLGGPEYGCANRNSDLEPAGTATQTILDITDNPMASIATAGEDGVTAFGALFVQNWWNGVEAGAQLAALTFYNADGEVIGELTYDVEIPEAPAEDTTVEEAPATGDVDAETDSSKGSPDTGVEDVAVVAGLAIVAAGVVLVSKKRK